MLPNALFQVIVSLANEVGHVATSLAHTAGSTHSVNVVNHVLSKLELDHMIHIQGVESPRGHVSAHHNRELTIHKQLKGSLSSLHACVLVVREILNVSFVKDFADLVDCLFGLCEDHQTLVSQDIHRSLHYFHQEVHLILLTELQGLTSLSLVCLERLQIEPFLLHQLRDALAVVSPDVSDPAHEPFLNCC